MAKSHATSLGTSEAALVDDDHGRDVGELTSTAFARARALAYVFGFRPSSLVMARFQTSGRDRAGTPRHQSSRDRGSRIAVDQWGRTCSSQMR